MKKRKLLVTGATGFIGRNVAEAFARRDDFEVHGTYFRSEPYAHPGIRLTRADLTRPEDADRVVQGMDVVIHAAAVTSGTKDIVNRPYVHITDNVVMSSLLFRAAFDRKVSRVVFFSCSTMYQSGDRPLKESDFDANQEMVKPYFGGGTMKVYLEKMCEFFSRLGETRFTAIRHSNIYGPYDKYDLERSHVFGATMAKVLSAADKVVVWGDGTEERDLLHVSDLADYVERAVDQQTVPYVLHNVGSGGSVPVAVLVQKIIACSGKPLRIEFDRAKPTIQTKVSLDCTQAAQAFGWKPTTSLEEGIRKTMEWYRNHVR